MKYSVHKVEFQNDNGIVKGIFTQYPLWLFENTQKRLRILDREGQLTDGRELDPDEWLIAWRRRAYVRIVNRLSI